MSGPRGGIHTRRFSLVFTRSQADMLQWLSERLGVSMGQILREQIKPLYEAERTKLLDELERDVGIRELAVRRRETR